MVCSAMSGNYCTFASNFTLAPAVTHLLKITEGTMVLSAPTLFLH